MHNQVNKSLQKPIFDCANIGDFYDCGCADDDEDEGNNFKDGKVSKSKSSKSDGPPAGKRNGGQKEDMTAEQIDRLSGSRGREFNSDLLRHAKDGI